MGVAFGRSDGAAWICVWIFWVLRVTCQEMSDISQRLRVVYYLDRRMGEGRGGDEGGEISQEWL